jgi:hypothetical protein
MQDIPATMLQQITSPKQMIYPPHQAPNNNYNHNYNINSIESHPRPAFGLMRGMSEGMTVVASTAFAPSVGVATPSRKRRAGVCDGFEWPSNTVRMRTSFTPEHPAIQQSSDTPMTWSPKRMADTVQTQASPQPPALCANKLEFMDFNKPASNVPSIRSISTASHGTARRHSGKNFCLVRTLTGTVVRVEAPYEEAVECLTVGMVKSLLQEQALCAPRDGVMVLWGKRVMGQCDDGEVIPNGAVLHLMAQFGAANPDATGGMRLV